MYINLTPPLFLFPEGNLNGDPFAYFPQYKEYCFILKHDDLDTGKDVCLLKLSATWDSLGLFFVEIIFTTLKALCEAIRGGKSGPTPSH